MLQAIFFDAVGTLIHLSRSVGENYREVAARFGEEMDADALDHAFKVAWSAAPTRAAGRGARIDDDKGWWRDLINRVLEQTLPPGRLRAFDRDGYFEAVYAHFAMPGVWQAFEDVCPVLEILRSRGLKLGLISNFDRRLRPILEDLEMSRFFEAVVISSEVGAEKPDPLIFETALGLLDVAARESMHVGDDFEKDGGAEAVGLQVFRLDRPERTLRDLLVYLDPLPGH